MASSSSSSEDPYPMNNDYEWVHGRGGVDPAIDDNINLVSSVPVQMPAIEELQQRNRINVSREGTPIPVSLPFSLPGSPKAEANRPSPLLSLPLELIDHILSFLSPLDVVATSATCRRLASSSKSDLVWQRYVQENVPGMKVTSPTPFNTFRELYISHDPHWFLTKYKIWFCDYFLTGKIIITRYNPNGRSDKPGSRGCIEGYQLIAEREPPSFAPWEIDDEVVIHSFNPECQLHRDIPVLLLNALRPLPSTTEQRFKESIRMSLNEPPDVSGVVSQFTLTSPVVPAPNMVLWPPLTIPARHRVRNANQESVAGIDSRPTRRSQVSNQAFRVRKWMEMGPQSRNPGMHIGEEVYTYATLDPKLYTPTQEKPFRGIWVGDYSGHGCEFLLMNQPDNETPFDESSVIRGEDETVEEFELRKKEERIYRGSLEAIKLTGDPNIPRGEYTFIADDISKRGLVRKADDPRFKGARIVQSRGHIAARMFRNDKYIESQLIMVSHDRLAQYWVGFGHISFYERVNLDKFLDPANDPPPPLPKAFKEGSASIV